MANQKANAIREAVSAIRTEETESAALQILPLPILRNSGLYAQAGVIKIVPTASNKPNAKNIENNEEAMEWEGAENLELPIFPILLSSELRLDVDGNSPQWQASGRSMRIGLPSSTWVAHIKKVAANTYEGDIWYKDGHLAAMPYTHVRIVVARTILSPTSATVTFTSGFTHFKVRYAFKSAYFHKIDFEFDCAEGVTPVLSYNTGTHPNRPATLPIENLSVATAFRRAGFDVSISGAGNIIPVGAGPDGKWSDAEMHDAMQVHWSKFANKPQWALWTFLASLHEMGTGLGGIMFDDIGPNHRQGCGIFMDSFIKNPPAGDPNPAAWVNRMKLWTVIHEMGHCCNLAHSWQKSLGTPWIPLANEPEARSFMNYPYNVVGGQAAFFADFQFRFSNGELLFMRHSPYHYVQPGNAEWFDNHGFRQNAEALQTNFELSLEFTNRTQTFDFLEPVVAHLTLKNISDQPQLVPEKILGTAEHITFIIKKRGKEARQLTPFAQQCWKDDPIVLKPNAQITDSIFLVGQNGWDAAEPGVYTLQASLEIQGQIILSKPASIRINSPKTQEEERIAQDFFSDEVGRVMAFDGSQFLQKANDTLKEVVDRLPKTKAAIHSRIALAARQGSRYKLLDYDGDTPTINTSRASHEEAIHMLEILQGEKNLCAATLGQVDFEYYVSLFKELSGHEHKAAKGNEIKVGNR